MKRAAIGWGIAFLILCCCSAAFGASREQKLVTRVDTVTVTFKHGTLAIKATGMARTPTTMDRGGKLVRRGAQPTLNKEGLLEDNMVFPAVANYGGFKLKPISARLHDKSIPAGIKGVRIYSEFNEVDGLLPEPQPKKSRSLLPFGKKKHQEGEDASH